MAADATAPEAHKLLREMLDAELNALNFAHVTALNAACAHLLSTGGQLIRGRLTFAAARLGPSPDELLVQRAASAIELLHLATLAHDDIIDSGVERRGGPTVSVQFGEKAAGFAGGWVFARSVEMIAECGAAAVDLFANTAREMCDGGMRELRDLYDPTRTVDDYFEVAGQKTASAFSLAARLGADLADSDVVIASRAAHFGREFGLAYQIWDDLIDLLSGSERSGKGPPSDLKHGVYTLPVLFAAEEREEIRERFLGVELDAAAQTEAATMIAGTRGVERAIQAADDHAKRAVGAISGLDESDWMCDLLEQVRLRHLEFLQ